MKRMISSFAMARLDIGVSTSAGTSRLKRIFRRRRHPEHGTQIENDAAFLAFQKLANRGAIRVKNRTHVQIEREMPALIRNLMQRPVSHLASASARDVIETIEPAKLLHGGG